MFGNKIGSNTRELSEMLSKNWSENFKIWKIGPISSGEMEVENGRDPFFISMFMGGFGYFLFVDPWNILETTLGMVFAVFRFRC